MFAAPVDFIGFHQYRCGTSGNGCVYMVAAIVALAFAGHEQSAALYSTGIQRDAIQLAVAT
jgi:hypothetical protein